MLEVTMERRGAKSGILQNDNNNTRTGTILEDGHVVGVPRVKIQSILEQVDSTTLPYEVEPKFDDSGQQIQKVKIDGGQVAFTTEFRWDDIDETNLSTKMDILQGRGRSTAVRLIRTNNIKAGDILRLAGNKVCHMTGAGDKVIELNTIVELVDGQRFRVGDLCVGGTYVDISKTLTNSQIISILTVPHVPKRVCRTVAINNEQQVFRLAKEGWPFLRVDYFDYAIRETPFKWTHHVANGIEYTKWMAEFSGPALACIASFADTLVVDWVHMINASLGNINTDMKGGQWFGVYAAGETPSRTGLPKSRFVPEIFFNTDNNNINADVALLSDNIYVPWFNSEGRVFKIWGTAKGHWSFTQSNIPGKRIEGSFNPYGNGQPTVYILDDAGILKALGVEENQLLLQTTLEEAKGVINNWKNRLRRMQLTRGDQHGYSAVFADGEVLPEIGSEEKETKREKQSGGKREGMPAPSKNRDRRFERLLELYPSNVDRMFAVLEGRICFTTYRKLATFKGEMDNWERTFWKEMDAGRLDGVKWLAGSGHAPNFSGWYKKHVNRELQKWCDIKGKDVVEVYTCARNREVKLVPVSGKLNGDVVGGVFGNTVEVPDHAGDLSTTAKQNNNTVGSSKDVAAAISCELKINPPPQQQQHKASDLEVAVQTRPVSKTRFVLPELGLNNQAPDEVGTALQIMFGKQVNNKNIEYNQDTIKYRTTGLCHDKSNDQLNTTVDKDNYEYPQLERVASSRTTTEVPIKVDKHYSARLGKLVFGENNWIGKGYSGRGYASGELHDFDKNKDSLSYEDSVAKYHDLILERYNEPYATKYTYDKYPNSTVARVLWWKELFSPNAYKLLFASPEKVALIIFFVTILEGSFNPYGNGQTQDGARVSIPNMSAALYEIERAYADGEIIGYVNASQNVELCPTVYVTDTQAGETYNMSTSWRLTTTTEGWREYHAVNGKAWVTNDPAIDPMRTTQYYAASPQGNTEYSWTSIARTQGVISQDRLADIKTLEQNLRAKWELYSSISINKAANYLPKIGPGYAAIAARWWLMYHTIWPALGVDVDRLAERVENVPNALVQRRTNELLPAGFPLLSIDADIEAKIMTPDAFQAYMSGQVPVGVNGRPWFDPADPNKAHAQTAYVPIPSGWNTQSEVRRAIWVLLWMEYPWRPAMSHSSFVGGNKIRGSHAAYTGLQGPIRRVLFIAQDDTIADFDLFTINGALGTMNIAANDINGAPVTIYDAAHNTEGLGQWGEYLTIPNLQDDHLWVLNNWMPQFIGDQEIMHAAAFANGCTFGIKRQNFTNSAGTSTSWTAIGVATAAAYAQADVRLGSMRVNGIREGHWYRTGPNPEPSGTIGYPLPMEVMWRTWKMIEPRFNGELMTYNRFTGYPITADIVDFLTRKILLQQLKNLHELSVRTDNPLAFIEPWPQFGTINSIFHKNWSLLLNACTTGSLLRPRYITRYWQEDSPVEQLAKAQWDPHFQAGVWHGMDRYVMASDNVPTDSEFFWHDGKDKEIVTFPVGGTTWTHYMKDRRWVEDLCRAFGCITQLGGISRWNIPVAPEWQMKVDTTRTQVQTMWSIDENIAWDNRTSVIIFYRALGQNTAKYRWKGIAYPKGDMTVRAATAMFNMDAWCLSIEGTALAAMFGVAFNRKFVLGQSSSQALYNNRALRNPFIDTNVDLLGQEEYEGVPDDLMFNKVVKDVRENGSYDLANAQAD